MSKNHQLPEYFDSIVARYKKVTIGAVSGIRLDPNDPKRRLSFLLESKFSNFNQDTKQLTFNYEDDVLELYSEREKLVFKQLNPYLFQSGLIAEYHGEKDTIVDQSVTDTDIITIAALKNTMQFKKRLSGITSQSTLQRIHDAVIAQNRPHSFVKAVAERLEKVQ